MGAGQWRERIPLRHAASPPPLAQLREPLGCDELAIAGVDTQAAVALLDRLLEAAPCPAGALSASDRDSLLAGLHRALWGDRIVSSLDCAACGARYDLSFELSVLQRALWRETPPLRVHGPRVVEDGAGAGLRLPDAAAECTAATLGLEAGRAALLTGLGTADTASLEAGLERLAPIIDVDLDSACAECGHAAVVRFDLQSFVLQRLLDGRGRVLDEVHALASCYGWSWTEITGLPRSLRQALVERLAPAAFG